MTELGPRPNTTSRYSNYSFILPAVYKCLPRTSPSLHKSIEVLEKVEEKDQRHAPPPKYTAQTASGTVSVSACSTALPHCCPSLYATLDENEMRFKWDCRIPWNSVEFHFRHFSPSRWKNESSESFESGFHLSSWMSCFFPHLHIPEKRERFTNGKVQSLFPVVFGGDNHWSLFWPPASPAYGFAVMDLSKSSWCLHTLSDPMPLEATDTSVSRDL